MMGGMTTNPTPPSAALYLRTDATLLLVRGEDAVEIRMSAAQLMSLAVDAFKVAVDLEPELVSEAAAVLAGAIALEAVETACPAH